MKRIPKDDLEYIFSHTKDLCESLRGKSIFLTGGTGFFGKWLLESFLFINEKLNLKVKIIALTRNPEQFLSDYPFYSIYSDTIRFVKGDVLTFDYDLGEKFEYIIHAATAASDRLNKEDPLLMMDTITLGTRKILDFAKSQPLEGFLFISSGAVYGVQPEDVFNIKESDSFIVNINNSSSAYAEGKRIAELYCSTYYQLYNLPIKIARCFAFVGPHLPLKSHFAIGNFIYNVINGEDIIIKGNGETIRSYMYASDLVISLLKILKQGANNKAYNVGSDKRYTMKELALIFKDIYGNNLRILNPAPDNKISIYVPNIDLLRTDLNIYGILPIETAIKKTVEFNLNYE